MKARTFKDLYYSWYLKIGFTLLVIFENSFKFHSPKGLCNFERIFKYRSQCKSLTTLSSIELPVLILHVSHFLLRVIKRLIRKTETEVITANANSSVNQSEDEAKTWNPCEARQSMNDRPRSIYQYSNIDPRFLGQNCKFFKFLLSLNSQKRLGNKENNAKYRSLFSKPSSHVRILKYRTWPILLRFANRTESVNPWNLIIPTNLFEKGRVPEH